MNEPVEQLLRRALTLYEQEQPVIACLLIKARGSTPQSAGALMLVDGAGQTFGTIGGGCVEAELRRVAQQMMIDGKSGLVDFKLDHDYGWDDGLICGGSIHLAVGSLPDVETLREIIALLESRQSTSLSINVDVDGETATYVLNLPPRPRLYIAGAGHVGQALARLAIPLEFDVTLFDDRADLLEKYGPSGVARQSGDIAEQLRAVRVDDQTYGVIVTRGHRHDEQALHALIGRGAKYLGMIGSRRKVKLIFDDLLELGVHQEDLERVHAPIGLDIGSVSVEEIALSIAAELVKVRRQDAVNAVDGPGLDKKSNCGADCSAGVVTEKFHFNGVLLAAGRGSRMGATKQLLPWPHGDSDTTVVGCAFDLLASYCDEMIVVVGHDRGAVVDALSPRNFHSVQSDPEAEMFDSMCAGLAFSAQHSRAANVMLHPADHVQVLPSTIDKLVSEFHFANDRQPLAVMGKHGDRGGHPVLIPNPMIDLILNWSGHGGLRRFWRDHANECIRIPIEDAGLVCDLDTPADYERGVDQR